MKPFLWGVSKLAGSVTRLHQGLYDVGLFKARRLTCPVISIGNLTVGGTGKTPITAFCLKLLLEKGHRPGLVVRSYRASLKAPQRVTLEGAASIFGDEALWYARQFPQVPVWAGPTKVDTADALVNAEKVDVVLVDDGFQHRALARDLNVLLLDSNDLLSAYQPFPLGRGREPLSAMKRADVILWTKWHQGKSRETLMTPPSVPVFHFESRLSGSLPEGPALVVSAIGRPELFFQMVQSLKSENLRRLDFRDHHPYGPEDILRIEDEARAMGAQMVLTTEKDEVKLRPLWASQDLPLLALPLEVRPVESVESFYEILRRPLGPRI